MHHSQLPLAKKNANLYARTMDVIAQTIAGMEEEVTKTRTAFAISTKVIEGIANSVVAFLMDMKIILWQLNRVNLSLT